MKSPLSLALTGLVCVPSALMAAPQIRQWNVASGVGTVSIDVPNRTVTILTVGSDPSHVLSFEAYDDSTNAPIDINLIELSGTIGAGLVRIQIQPDPSSARTHGAATVKKISLTKAGNTGELVSAKISGDFGSTGTNTIVVDTVTGLIEADGSIANTFDASAGGVTGSIDIGGDIATARQLKVGDMTGDITVGGDIGSGGGGVNGISAGNLVGNIEVGGYLSGNITLESLDGNLLLTQTGGSTHGGSVTIGTAMAPTSYDGEITCLARAGGNWTFHGDVDGELEFQRVFSGTMTITAGCCRRLLRRHALRGLNTAFEPEPLRP